MAAEMVFANPKGKGKGGGGTPAKSGGRGKFATRRGFAWLPPVRTVAMTAAGAVAATTLPAVVGEKLKGTSGTNPMATGIGAVLGSAVVGVGGGALVGSLAQKSDGVAFAVGGLSVAVSRSFNLWVLPWIMGLTNQTPPAPGTQIQGEDGYTYEIGADGWARQVDGVEVGADVYAYN